MKYDPLEERVEHLLQTYSLEEILEQSGVEINEALYQLIQLGVVTLPDVEPL